MAECGTSDRLFIGLWLIVLSFMVILVTLSATVIIFLFTHL